MTWTDFKEYSSDVQLQIGRKRQIKQCIEK